MTTQRKKSIAPSISGRQLSVAGLFAGIGGIEAGLHRSGHTTELLCEIEPAAVAVLETNFPDVAIHHDVSMLRSLPTVDVVTAGFPCQDISLAGTRSGLEGARSGLVSEVFRLVERGRPEFLLLENVQHLLRLSSGANMHIILNELERLKYRWAYRIVDTRGFGLPQRRHRVIILASRGDVDPGAVLFNAHVLPDFDDTIGPLEEGHTYGFYWTEGKRGVGWARDAVPTIKGGSGLGIPSPPAIFDPATGTAGTPTICDAERLQGFEPGWTDATLNDAALKAGQRWKMVGNAVSVPLADWLGRELASPASAFDSTLVSPLDSKRAWPTAAYGNLTKRSAVAVSTHVEVAAHEAITDFLHDPLKPLSKRALMGYMHRARTGTKKFPDGFIEALEIQAEAS